MPKTKPAPDARSVMHQAVIDALRSEGDRAAAVLGAAVLDAQLENILRSSLLHFTPKDSFEALFSGNGPLATFSARINLAYSLGWISGATRHDLHIIRDIRNSFAHTFEHSATFETQGMPERLQQLKTLGSSKGGVTYSLELPSDGEGPKQPGDGGQSRSVAHDRFVIIVAIIAGLLSNARARAKPPEEWQDRWVIGELL